MSGESPDLVMQPRRATSRRSVRFDVPTVPKARHLSVCDMCSCTVAEAIEVLRASVPELHPIALSFEVTQTRGVASAANRVTIPSAERHGSVMRFNDGVVPTPHLSSRRARGEAKDDVGNQYCD